MVAVSAFQAYQSVVRTEAKRAESDLKSCAARIKDWVKTEGKLAFDNPLMSDCLEDPKCRLKITQLLHACDGEDASDDYDTAEFRGGKPGAEEGLTEYINRPGRHSRG